MEGPLPPLTKIVDDVEGVGVEVMLFLINDGGRKGAKMACHQYAR